MVYNPPAKPVRLRFTPELMASGKHGVLWAVLALTLRNVASSYRMASGGRRRVTVARGRVCRFGVDCVIPRAAPGCWILVARRETRVKGVYDDMSLFENDEYRWRDTYFVLFQEHDRPSPDTTLQALESLGPHYAVRNVRYDQHGALESFTVFSPDDFAAMDISCISGEEVIEQINGFVKEMSVAQPSEQEAQRLERLQQCNARFDVYHFEQVAIGNQDDDEGFFDPGALLLVLQCLASLCKGTGIDPQTGTIV